MPPRASTALFTSEDAKAALNIFCCVCGIGSLGMPANFARAGWVFATIALLFMAFANIYASVVLSKVFLVAPSTVKTYSDLGDWVAGTWGRLVVLVSQMGVCLLLPCAFLVLGSTLLDVLFPDCFSQSVWIIFMAATIIPVALIPTMKESTGMAIAGCLGTIVADIIGLSILVTEMKGHPSPPPAAVTTHQVINTFGNLSLAYAAATVIPDLQRQHSQPERMPRIIIVSLGIASAFFFAVAITGYVSGGCQMSGNLLFSVVNTSDPLAFTALHFVADRGAIVMAFLFMQMHLSVAFTTMLHPAFYMFERMILGMHKVESLHIEGEEKSSYLNAPTPGDLESNRHHGSQRPISSQRGSSRPRSSRLSGYNRMVAEEDMSEYTGGANVVRYIGLRIVLIITLVVASLLLRDHFLDLVDFTGASFITLSSLLAPLVFYMKIFWNKIPIWEKFMCVTIALVCSIAGIYVMISSGQNLFSPSRNSDAPNFPYCSVEFQDDPYYVRSEAQ
ncbi:amino acid auxin permease family [Plasmopara halstedii]|uniref:Amino acid auxin permease family n=1 Tax=Plasmopara halstedii TaxID=4781 RepID=A0A0P1AS05_PLAHL|nr:amino acid auxin permease family [Plasmopara halstedii]CEG44447.1 amino acid auxin permease family [Plasmopara halstedii]|eukprot:XP_024580816.1 amino acid auxin permease family [Plasmopara halstedii]